MSQPSTRLSDSASSSALDAFFTPMSDDGSGGSGNDGFSHQNMDDLFDTDEGGHTFSFTATPSEVFDDLDLDFRFNTTPSVGTPATGIETGASTPDFSTFTFPGADGGGGGNEEGNIYPTPPGGSQNCYPLEMQQRFQQGQAQYQQHQRFQQQQQQFRQYRPVPVRSHTNVNNITRVFPQHQQYAYPPTQPPHHRRSLSHSDADCLLLPSFHPHQSHPQSHQAKTNKNPTFFRLQTPRARSTGPSSSAVHADEPRGRGRGRGRTIGADYDGKGSSVEKCASRAGTPTSVPMARVLSGRKMPTMIGTPLDDQLLDLQHVHRQRRQHASSPSTPYSHSRSHSRPQTQTQSHDQAYFVHMSPRDCISSSKKVIEIGAMAIINIKPSSTVVDPRLAIDTKPAGKHSLLNDRSKSISNNTQPRPTSKETILAKLRDVETHLVRDFGGCDEGLRGCEIVRAVLERGGGSPFVGEGALVEGNVCTSSSSPSERLSLEKNYRDVSGEGDFDVIDVDVDVDAPSAVFAERDAEILGGDGEGDLFRMLVEETGGEGNDMSE